MTASGSRPLDDSPPPGLRVGDYELVARIGEGGMGVVHLGRGRDGRRVAIKVLRPHVVGDDEARERLAREVGSLSRVASPRIAEIVDADPWGPVPFVATRYVPGPSLHDLVREQGPLPADDLTGFALGLAEALSAVHAVGVLHRDVKPSNVLLEGRTPVLIDFGLARLADDPRLTHTGWLMGTPGYLAPEILHGEEASTASDVHAWAATVAFAGTGHSPFGGGPGMAIMDRVRRGEHDLSGLPAGLAHLLEAALDPDPARRPTLTALQERLAGGDEPLTRPWPLAGPVDEEDDTAVLPGTAGTGFEAPDPDPAYRSGREPWAVRLRRTLLVLLGAVAGGAGLAAYPWVGLAILAPITWVLRSLSLSGSAAWERRTRRGPRWHDGPRALLAMPWHVVAAVPGTLVLLAWALGLAAAAGLLCYAAALEPALSLLASGTVFAGALWVGPGGRRIRGPVRRVVDPICRTPWVWLLVTAVVVGVAAGTGWAALQGGPDWYPATRHPLAPGTFLGDLLRSLPG